MKKEYLAFSACVLLAVSIILFLALMGGGGLWALYSAKTFLILSLVLFGIAVIIALYQSYKRPWRSGSKEYQKLKRTTYKQLKATPCLKVGIAQAFFMDAEHLGIVRNVYMKDFDLMWKDVN